MLIECESLIPGNYCLHHLRLHLSQQFLILFILFLHKFHLHFLNCCLVGGTQDLITDFDFFVMLSEPCLYPHNPNNILLDFELQIEFRQDVSEENLSQIKGTVQLSLVHQKGGSLDSNLDAPLVSHALRARFLI